MKSQSVRVADVFFIGPLMIWGGLRLRGEYPAAGAILAGLGGATIVYNARNWYMRDRIEGTQGAPDSFDAHELSMGIAEEMEHTGNPGVAREIALDHLAEDPRYYSKLRAAGF